MHPFVKQLGILLGLLAATAALWCLGMWLSFTIDSESGFRHDLAGIIGQGTFWICVIGVFWIFGNFFSNVRPLFTDGTVRNLGCATALLGVLMMVSPIIVSAVTGGPSGNMFDESTSAGAVLWLLIYTVPGGVIIAIVGTRIFMRNRSKR